MGQTARPSASQVADFLTSQGVAVSFSGGVSLSQFAEAAGDEFDRTAGRQMLADAADSTRRFDPPSNAEGRLWFGADLAVLTGVTYQPEGAASESLVLGQEYVALGLAGTVAEEPLTEPLAGLRVFRRWVEPLAAELHGSLRVTGRWGYADEIPEDAWLAMLQRAAALAAPMARGARDWNASFEAAVRRYRRWGVG